MNKINKDYTHFIVDTNRMKIVDGYEYKEDAIEIMQDIKEDYKRLIQAHRIPQLKVYTIKYLTAKNINPFNINNWSNLSLI